MPVHVLGAPQIDDRSLARITAYSSERTEIGTGFVIASGQIVTTYHVVQGARRIDVVVAGKPYRDVEVVAVRPEADLALLQAPMGPTVAFYRTTEGSRGAPGATVYLHGVPLGFDRQLLVGRLTQSGYLQSQQWADRNGQGMFLVRDLSLVPIDITSEPGVSGAPVLDEQGTVFGVFSGSLQAGGRGYSWAVPMYYANIEQMQQINKPASAIAQWPAFPYLRPGLSLLRSLNPNSEGARLARRCRERIDHYTGAFETQVDIGNHLLLKWEMLKTGFDAILQGRSVETVESQLRRLKFAWDMMEPQLTAFLKAQERFEASGGRMITSCASPAGLGSLAEFDYPGTPENVRFRFKIERRIDALFDASDKEEASQQASTRDAEEDIRRLFELVQSSDGITDEQWLRNLSEAYRLLHKNLIMFLSDQQADYVAHHVHFMRSWAEIVEAIELHPWERGHKAYSYRDPSGITVGLAHGWFYADAELRELLLGKRVPENLKLLRLGTLKTLRPPQAMGEVYWQASVVPQPTDSSRLPAYWRVVDDHWQALQRREGFAFSNAERYEHRVGDDLLLEITGDGQHRNQTVRVYAAHRFSTNGTASVICIILSPELGYESCTELTDSLRLPR